ncbi:glycerol-3-phosphate 1-O-acyltransferase PlsY [bacterium]|nr:glycerol-3-phosphate 1-O-acyltransferase PlsY [bacterium]
MVEILIFVILAYVIGSIPTGYIVVKLAKGQDIRKIGSGSTGATNVKRVMGKKWFFIVLLLDALKGALPVVLACFFASGFRDLGLIPVLCAVAVILGHSKSIFLNFTGGKSVASGVGTILALNWQVGLIIAAIWAVITYISRYVSLGSIIALCLSPILMYLFNQPIAYVIYCLIGAVYITYLHRQNIQRLLKGEENKVR